VTTLAPIEIAPGIKLGGAALPFIAGPCVLESEHLALEVARRLATMAAETGFQVIFKGSFDKANRTSITSYRGPGLEEGLRILASVKAHTGLPVTTDVHEIAHCRPAAEVCSILQIPAFLCRQTDLLVAAAETGRTVNIKKGQFVAPADMRHAVAKVREAGNERVFVTERGASFGYGQLVVDMRSFAILRELGIYTIFDVTHSLQMPGRGGDTTDGDRRFAEPLALAAVAAGAAGIFMEVHPHPEQARSDAATQLPPDRADHLMRRLAALRRHLGPPA
jgi:2-dehydro-3-deoxyphosphooctonate aldolase (KDO 8-P synthase)